jgi:hypothetical protein
MKQCNQPHTFAVACPVSTNLLVLCHCCRCHHRQAVNAAAAVTLTDAEATRASLAAVGTWAMQVCLMRLPDLSIVAAEALQGEVIPRCAIMCCD